MTEQQPIIEFRNVKKSFDDKVVLEDVSFAVPAGSVFCIIGGSGTGKSVTLKLLLGLMPVDSGEIYFKGKLITEMTELELNRLRLQFGMVFQGSALFDSMSVYENVAYPLLEQDKYTDDEVEKLVLEKLEVVGLAEAVDLFPGDLSGGMKKRIGLARAIATSPEVVLYDEPTAGLDPANVKRIDNLILRMQDKFNVTSVLVTHNMESVYNVADHVALLYNKKIAFCGSLDEFSHTDNPMVRQFVTGDLGHD